MRGREHLQMRVSKSSLKERIRRAWNTAAWLGPNRLENLRMCIG